MYTPKAPCSTTFAFRFPQSTLAAADNRTRDLVLLMFGHRPAKGFLSPISSVTSTLLNIAGYRSVCFGPPAHEAAGFVPPKSLLCFSPPTDFSLLSHFHSLCLEVLRQVFLVQKTRRGGRKGEGGLPRQVVMSWLPSVNFSCFSVYRPLSAPAGWLGSVIAPLPAASA